MEFVTYDQIIEDAIRHPKWNIDPKRAKRALAILKDHKPGTMVMKAKTNELNYSVSEFDNIWIVRASKGGWYYVRPDQGTCTCPDRRKGTICKHRLAVYAYTQQIKQTHQSIIQEAKERSQDGSVEDLLLADLGF
ncbi:MAG: SWIM zinc finger family protein [Planctomycetota bacterium]|jgi:hypothetical protein